MSDPYARALSAIDYLFVPDLDPVARGALDEVRDAVLEARARYAAAMEELRLLKTTRTPEPVTIDTLDNSAPRMSGEAKPHENGTALLAALDLLPEEPISIGRK
jgi:hypothetical protein